MEGIIYLDKFIENSLELYHFLLKNVNWDESMTARKTASYGKAYNYSQIEYPNQEFIPELQNIITEINPIIGFKPNNCLINFYKDGSSKMGYHSDQIDILQKNTGVAIVSLGETRQLKFRNIINPEETINYELATGSLFYMTQDIQKHWQHAIPKSTTENGRISLTFRNIV